MGETFGTHDFPAEGSAVVLDDQQSKEYPKPELAFELKKEVLDSLAERYPDHRETFERFAQLPSIKFERGKVNYIFGPNGSGKSTLANAIFLAAKTAYFAQRKMAESEKFGGKKLEPEEARKEAIDRVLHPDRSTRHALAELIGMAAAPRLVEEGALELTQFQSRGGYGLEKGLKSDTPIVHRIAVQDMLGEERRKEEEYMADTVFSGNSAADSSYAESGASARQMIEAKLKREFEGMNPGSIVVMDEAAFGLSPKRQEEYIKMLEQFAREKDLIVIAPENSGYAYDSSSLRIDLETPQQGLHLSEARDNEARAGVIALESSEVLPEATMKFSIDRDKIRELAEKHPKFRQMLEGFSGLPDSFAFGPGKTEIFADNGGGKTTILGIMYLLMQIEAQVDGRIQMDAIMKRKTEDRETLRKSVLKSLVTDPSQPGDKVFIESLGFARELIASGAIALGNSPVIPSRFSVKQGTDRIVWMNLLDVSGKIKQDNFRIIEYSDSQDANEISDEIKELRPDRTPGSTRQTSETLLLQTLQRMPEGGFLFVDEIDGGISPGRQLRISEAVHKLAKERKITMVATSNSYEGFKYRLTPSLDLFSPGSGVIPPSHGLAEAV